MIVFLELDDRPEELDLLFEELRLAVDVADDAAAAVLTADNEVDLPVDVYVLLPLVRVITVVTTIGVSEVECVLVVCVLLDELETVVLADDVVCAVDDAVVLEVVAAADAVLVGVVEEVVC